MHIKNTINPIHWELDFPNVFISGGFDAVIGNPPYIPIEQMSENYKKYFTKSFEVLERKYDSSVLFILFGLQLLNEKGFMSYISSITWQTGENYINLRKSILTKNDLIKIINLPYDIFVDAYVDTGIYMFGKHNNNDRYEIYQFPKKEKLDNLSDIKFDVIKKQKICPPEFKVILTRSISSILEKTKNSSFISLGEITESTQGLAGNKFEILDANGENLFPYLTLGQGYRYLFNIDETKFTDMSDFQTLIKYYTNNERILFRRIINRQNRLMACYYNKDLIVKKDLNPFIITNDNYNIHYILSIVNSKLISFLYLNQSTIATKDDFRQTTLSELRKLPIPIIDSLQQSKLSELSKGMVTKNFELIEKLNEFLEWLKLEYKINKISQKLKSFYELDFDTMKQEVKKKMPKGRSIGPKEIGNLKKNFDEYKTELLQIQNEIENTDAQIDQMVYKLYDLTYDEVKIVEPDFKMSETDYEDYKVS